jgi:CheY-like chemotaxis protein
VGRGSRFTVYLPGAVSGRQPASISPFRDARPGIQETILLVEDEEVVRRVAQAMLSRSGYRVLSAANSDEALRIWSAHSAAIDLLLTDMVIPGGLTGIALGQQLRQTKPKLKIILMSGYSAEFAATEGERGVAFLAKPFESRTLAKLLRKSLNEA